MRQDNPKATSKQTRGRSKRNILRELNEDFGPQGGMKEDEVMELGYRAYQWAMDALDDPSKRRLSLRKFWQLNHIHPASPAKNWYRRYPKFKILCEAINQIIGTIREERMLYRELDPHKVGYNLHNYLPEYRKADEYHDDRAIRRDREKAKNIAQEIAVTGRVWFDKEKDNKP